MTYKEIPPPRSLEGFVKVFWIVENDGTAKGDQVYRILPHSCPRLVFHYHNHFHEFRGDMKHGQVPIAVLKGHTCNYQEYAACGDFGFMGAYLYPFVPSLMFGIHAMEYINRVLPLETLLDRSECALLQQGIRTAADNEERVRVLAFFLETRLAHSSILVGAFEGLIKEISEQKGNIAVTELARLSSLSIKQLERKFYGFIGMTPKTFCRIVRFQSTLALRRQCVTGQLTSIALDTGYYDQAHFINDFRRLAGFPPSSYFNRNAEMTADILVQGLALK